MPKISIIIPFYNCQKYIEECITSVLNQTYKDIEILLINDGSTDESESIINSFKDIRIKHYSQKHSGVSTARNLGIEKSESKYIMFLDADDWLEEDTCEKLINRLSENENTQVLFFNFKYNTEKTSKIFKYPNGKGINILKQHSLPFNNVMDSVSMLSYVIWNRIYDADFLKKNKIIFNKKYSLSEDLLFSIELFVNNPKISITDEALYNYRIRENSASRISFEAMFNILVDIYKFVINQNYYDSKYKSFIDNMFLKMCIFIYFHFLSKDNKKILCSKIEEVLILIRKQKNINIINSFRYRKLLFIVLNNKILNILKHKLCIS